MISAVKLPGGAAGVSDMYTETGVVVVFSTSRCTMLQRKLSAGCFGPPVLECFSGSPFVVMGGNVVALIAECISTPLSPTSPMLLPSLPFPQKWCDTETL